MRKFFITLLLLLFDLMACPPRIDRCAVYLNKPGIMMKPIPQEMIEALHSQTRADRIIVQKQDTVMRIVIVKKPRYKAVSLSSSVDLLSWFKDKKCVRSWERFHRCMNQKQNPDDERLYRKLDREFVARVICEERSTCEDPDFSRWRLRWDAPAHIVLETDIGNGGFTTTEAAKKSLHRINVLLKRVLYGARFPESVSESTADAYFLVNEVPVQKYDFKKSLKVVLKKLKERGYLHGIDRNDIHRLSKLAEKGKLLYFVAEKCDRGGKGWQQVSNSVRIRFDDKRCPSVEILR